MQTPAFSPAAQGLNGLPRQRGNHDNARRTAHVDGSVMYRLIELQTNGLTAYRDILLYFYLL